MAWSELAPIIFRRTNNLLRLELNRMPFTLLIDISNSLVRISRIPSAESWSFRLEQTHIPSPSQLSPINSSNQVAILLSVCRVQTLSMKVLLIAVSVFVFSPTMILRLSSSSCPRSSCLLPSHPFQMQSTNGLALS